jgi:hypothetical protein
MQGSHKQAVRLHAAGACFFSSDEQGVACGSFNFFSHLSNRLTACTAFFLSLFSLVWPHASMLFLFSHISNRLSLSQLPPPLLLQGRRAQLKPHGHAMNIKSQIHSKFHTVITGLTNGNKVCRVGQFGKAGDLPA